MEDKEARARLEKLEGALGSLEVKYCPKCKHKTVHQNIWLTVSGCLHCGRQWHYTGEQRIKEVGRDSSYFLRA